MGAYTLASACGPWTTVEAVRGCCSKISDVPGESNYVSDEQLEAEIDVATDLLYVMSGKQFTGICEAVIRPCGRPSCLGTTELGVPSDPSSWPPPKCGCGTLDQIDLSLWPVNEVTEVLVDGEVVDEANYRVDKYRYLTALADYRWPRCQHLNLPETEEGTFQVSLTYGIAPPAAGELAATRLTCELAKSCVNVACQLPARATSVNRQQITYTMLNPEMLDKNLTGIYEVDVFIHAFNPGNRRGNTLVWSPDLSPAPYRMTVPEA